MHTNNISVVVALNNEEKNVDIVYSRIKEAFESINSIYELVFVDDGSRDKTHLKLLEIHKKDPKVNIISLKKNIGQTLSLIIVANK